jgi:hypothetical protein
VSAPTTDWDLQARCERHDYWPAYLRAGENVVGGYLTGDRMKVMREKFLEFVEQERIPENALLDALWKAVL